MQNFVRFPNDSFHLPRQVLNLFRYNRRYRVNQTPLQSTEICQRSLSTSFRTFKRIEKEYKAIINLLLGRRTTFNLNEFLLKCDKRVSRPGNFPPPHSGKSSGSSGSQSGSPGNDNDKDKQKELYLKMVLWAFATNCFLLISYAVLQQYRQDKSTPMYISWNDFVFEMLAKGEVQELVIKPELDLVMIYLHEGAIIKGERAVRRSYYMFVNDLVQFEEKLRKAEDALGIRYDKRLPITYDRESRLPLYLITSILLLMVLLFSMNPKASRIQQSSMPFFGVPSVKAKYTLIDPAMGTTKGVKFSDVAGLTEAKVEVTEFVDYLKNPEKYKRLGAKVPRGALLLGPPGCGKTLLAKALASEANVPFLSMSGSEFIEVIGGLGAARMRNLFKDAKKFAPSIIYIDEIDAIGRKRAEQSWGDSSENDQTLNQLLVEMDGMQSRQDVIVLASTNRSDVLDKALLRPGRFDRHILIDLPTLAERKQMFELHLKEILLEYPATRYSSQLAHLTPGFSGADIAAVCNEAALHAAREKKSKVNGADLYYAIDRMIGGPEKRDNAMSPSERKVVAYHEAGHALVGWLLEHTDALMKVSIVPRTNMSLGFAQYTPIDQKLLSREQLFDRMCMILGGRAAESLIFNSITQGAQNDLEKVTKMAYAQVQQFGMNDVVGLVSFYPQQLDTSTAKPYSKRMAALMDIESRKLIAKAYRVTEELLNKNIDKLELLAAELLKKETINHTDVTRLIGPPPFGNKKFVDPDELQRDIKVNSPQPVDISLDEDSNGSKNTLS